MLGIWTNMVTIAAETQRVAWLAMMKMATGFAANQDEAALITSERGTTAAQATARSASRSIPESVVRSHRKKVRANTRRSSTGSSSMKRRTHALATIVRPQISEARSKQQTAKPRTSKLQASKRGKR